MMSFSNFSGIWVAEGDYWRPVRYGGLWNEYRNGGLTKQLKKKWLL